MTAALCRRDNTVRTCMMCSSAIRENIMMSSKNIKLNCILTVDKVTSMVLWKVAGGLQSPNDMQESLFISSVIGSNAICAAHSVSDGSVIFIWQHLVNLRFFKNSCLYPCSILGAGHGFLSWR